MSQGAGDLERQGHPLRQALWAAGILICSAAAAWGLSRCDRPAKRRAAPAFQWPVTVQVARTQNATMTVRGDGTVQPEVTIQIVSQVTGTVLQIHADLQAGGCFAAGELLITIDPADYHLAVQQAQAQVDQAAAALQQAAARVQEFETQVQDAELEARRLRELHRQQSTTQRELEKGELALQRAKAQLVGGQAAGSQARAARAQVQSHLTLTRLQLERTRMDAPFAGCVLSEQVDAGQFVASGQTLASVYATAPMQIRVPLEDSQLAWFDLPGPASGQVGPRRGAKATVQADFAGRQRTWHGTVQRLEGQVDPVSRMVNVVVQVGQPHSDDADRMPLMPGTFTQVRIHGRQLANVVAIQPNALRGQHQVWLVRDQMLQVEDVQVVRKQRDTVYVRGLQEGQFVVTSALDVVSDGMAVTIVKTDGAVQSAEAGDPATEPAKSIEQLPGAGKQADE